MDNGWSKTLLKKTISILLIYSLFFTSSANAANVGGWSLSNPVSKGASVIYDATKNIVINGKDFVKDSWVKITPNATQVAKVLARGAAGYALSVAVEQLLGAVDWVLEPENNRIKYWKDVGGVYQVGGYADTQSQTKEAACRKYYDNHKTGSYEYKGAIGDECYWTNPDAPNRTFKWPIFTVQTGEKEEKYLPLPTAAQQVISNAADGDAAAQQATTAAAADIVAEAEQDQAKARPIANQAEANAETKPADEAEAEKANEAQGQSKPNEANPEAMDISLEFPVFCSWAPTICEAAQVVISFPNTLTGWYNDTKTKAEEWASSIAEAWTAAKDWAKNEENEEQDNDPPEIKTIDIGQLDTGTFKATAGCPAPIQVPLNLGTGGNVEISYEPICQFASKWSFVAPLIGFLSGAMILVGVGRKGEDGEI